MGVAEVGKTRVSYLPGIPIRAAGCRRSCCGALAQLMKQHRHEVHLTSQELARMAHCSRQSLYQAIKLLTQQRVVRQRYGYLEVLDTEKLKRIYEGHD